MTRNLRFVGGSIDDCPEVDEDGSGPREHQKGKEIKRCCAGEEEKGGDDAPLDQLTESGDEKAS